MDGTAIKAMMAELAPVIREYVSQQTQHWKGEREALLKRIDDLEARPAYDPECNEVMVLRLVQDEVSKIPAPIDGKDADPEETARLVDEKVGQAVAALPQPSDGKSVTVEDLAPMVAAEVEKAVQALPVPVSVRNLVVDRNGDGVLTYSDGTTQNIGKMVGTDGRDADMPALERLIVEKVNEIPRPKDGRDGFNLEDFDCQPIDERTIELRFQRGEERHVFALEFPVIVDRGVFKAGETYRRGDAVTWGGSLWIAQKETGAKPDSPDSGFRLAVKKGRDGKDAK